jgi:NAD(P)-dependent dehydrogenase (short-subunit alcohol dehydrogenase family)
MNNVLITGTNRGLGLGFTRHYLERGCRVFATARNPAGCVALRDRREAFGDRLVLAELDLVREDSIADAVSSLADTPLDLVINNAGALVDETFGTWSAETFTRLLAVNTIGPALLAQALLPRMKPGSKLVNISSGLGSCGLGINPETGLDAYAASKAALNMITCRLAAKPEGEGRIVVACDPGWVRTRMGGPEADLSVEESVAAITAMIDELELTDSGRFVSRHGKTLPW